MDKVLINKEDSFENVLSEEFYFQSLIQFVHHNNLLNINHIQGIQIQLSNILSEIVGYYTKNKSSSVRVETAEQIMLSICYTIGIFLKSQLTLKESINLIKDKELKYLFSQGEKLLKLKVDKCYRLFNIVKETELKIGNYAYIDTIYYGIPLFFQQYDIRFASHDTPGSIDYPLAFDEMNKVGIEYIEDYLSKLIIENKFCSYFDISEIKDLLRGFDKNCDHLLANVFQLVLTNYLGRILIGEKGRSLDISKEDRAYIKNIIENLNKIELERLFFMATEKLCSELLIENKNIIEYINKAVASILPEIRRNIKTDTLENIFISLRKSENKSIKYVDGKSLSNSKFRNITEEIRDCRNVEGKIKIIKEEIHSFRDLVDVLGAGCIFDDEFIDVFSALDDFEIALLIKNISDNVIFDTDYCTEDEKEWQEKFKVYLDSLDDIKKKDVIRISKEIEI